jgi:hypothetical protein
MATSLKRKEISLEDVWPSLKACLDQMLNDHLAPMDPKTYMENYTYDIAMLPALCNHCTHTPCDCFLYFVLSVNPSINPSCYTANAIIIISKAVDYCMYANAGPTSSITSASTKGVAGTAGAHCGGEQLYDRVRQSIEQYLTGVFNVCDQQTTLCFWLQKIFITFVR